MLFWTFLLVFPLLADAFDEEEENCPYGVCSQHLLETLTIGRLGSGYALRGRLSSSTSSCNDYNNSIQPRRRTCEGLS
ncbi:hypothetical protein OSTOST_23266 [Ostertagia ostertagi]